MEDLNIFPFLIDQELDDKVTCPMCDGMGINVLKPYQDCKGCNGTGQILIRTWIQEYGIETGSCDIYGRS